ncbi:MAG: hypothetical protein HY052_09670 [Proteobacteria bacterium]|nr:hypothetical protein [Pseudomonadota bacterium]
MRTKYIYLMLCVFLIGGGSGARADQVHVAVNDVRAPVAGTASFSDEALASYIGGRLRQALKTEDDSVEQYCDATGCSVVVQ